MTYNLTYRFLLSMRFAISGPATRRKVPGRFCALTPNRGTPWMRPVGRLVEGRLSVAPWPGVKTGNAGSTPVRRFAAILPGGRCSRADLAWGYCLGSGQAIVNLPLPVTWRSAPGLSRRGVRRHFFAPKFHPRRCSGRWYRRSQVTGAKANRHSDTGKRANHATAMIQNAGH